MSALIFSVYHQEIKSVIDQTNFNNIVMTIKTPPHLSHWSNLKQLDQMSSWLKGVTGTQWSYWSKPYGGLAMDKMERICKITIQLYERLLHYTTISEALMSGQREHYACKVCKAIWRCTLPRQHCQKKAISIFLQSTVENSQEMNKSGVLLQILKFV